MERGKFTPARRTALVASLALLMIAGGSRASARTVATASPTGVLVREAAASLVARHLVSPTGTGWAWRSSIQRPHLQTDRDVGAASVGMGLIAAHDVTHNPAFIGAAQQAGDFLISAETPAGSGRWPDYVDPNGAARYGFTSFDDGSAGIADYLWRLYERTGDARYRTAALAGIRWVISQAHRADGVRCPAECRWSWYWPHTAEAYNGIGEGTAGIVWTLDAFARRTGNAWFEEIALGGARYLERQMSPGGAIPETPYGHGYDTGYLSGQAGHAFLFLTLYRHTGNRRWLQDATRLLQWESQHAQPQAAGGVAWPIELGPGGSSLRATGVEEGNAGILWVYLQAYETTGTPAYLQMARRAAVWLLAVARHQDGGQAWQEDAGRHLIHTSLDNGAPGIAITLFDLGRVTHDHRYTQAAIAAERWVAAVSRRDPKGIYWYENRHAGSWHIRADPSWHWGTAGIIDMAARLDGWRLDIPGEQPGF